MEVPAVPIIPDAQNQAQYTPATIPIGTVFGRLTVVGRPVITPRPSGKGKQYHYPCRCTCPDLALRHIDGKDLLRGASQSCGCLRVDACKKRATHHRRDNPVLYELWRNMRRRHQVCPIWDIFTNFAIWAYFEDYQPGQVLQVIDPSLPYSSTNCRFQ